MSLIRYRYQTLEFGERDIHVRTLRDVQQFHDEGGEAEKLGISSALWPLFGIVWISSEVLASLMQDYDVDGKRILEVGCGIGLASLMLGYRHADITATDYHPAAAHFLKENERLNGLDPIPFHRASWYDEETGLGTFDLVIGSDLLYERQHIDALAGFIDRHAREHCEVIVVDPGRGNATRFTRAMQERGYTHHPSPKVAQECPSGPFVGYVLRYTR
ncbi:class I SAM-dependent methyltransferase [Lentisalinibacter orientalis]|uniref:class I SAM-dependent methyltransferase n=1 Tax=Lentisalinibacter orientalis TaxID=2992241 RepID=UPI003866EB25